MIEQAWYSFLADAAAVAIMSALGCLGVAAVVVTVWDVAYRRGRRDQARAQVLSVVEAAAAETVALPMQREPVDS